MYVSPEEVLRAISSSQDRMRAIEVPQRSWCVISALLRAAKAHCLGVCMQLEDLMQDLRVMTGDIIEGDRRGFRERLPVLLSVHAVQPASVRIDSSSSNTHGAQERNRKLKKFSKAYQKLDRATKKQPLDSEDGSKQHCRNSENSDGHKNFITKEKESFGAQLETSALSKQVTNDLSTSDNAAECPLDPNDSDSGSSFLSMLSLDVIENVSPRVHPSLLSLEEREKRKREYAEESSRREERGNDRDSNLFSPLTSYISAETELKTLITELEDAVLVGLHTCGDLAPSTLRMFRAKQELCAVCSVSCCYTCSLKSLIRTDRGQKSEAEHYFLKAIELDPARGNCYMHYSTI
ncbi:methyltransferase-like protein 25 isoform X2 [Cyprinus carpio]|uniref:Methyltransferase-like protein 25 isoform X2 n=1 Tax=Cyprinus carpio TaxID=7962 RepID=A0A9Q9XA16_CYPCA|nr:methyltransferase-like protein 25 isoform X2 [Cyprinus carpio]